MDVLIIGCGNMGSGLAELLGPYHRMFLHDHVWNWTQELSKKIEGTACQSLQEAIGLAEVIFLAIKPQNLKEIAPLISPYLKKDHILISLLAGTPLSTLRTSFLSPTLVRIMPNLAMCYGEGIVGIADSPDFPPHLKESLETILAPLGLLYWLKEEQIDALASLASSGPAFIFTLIEAMIEAGVAMGFKPQNAQDLIVKMIQGSLSMLEKTEEHPAKLKMQIASPGGTTIAGLRKLEEKNVRSGLIETFLATYRRGQELANESEQ